MTNTRNPYKFKSLANALSFCYEHCVRPMRVVMGDDEMFWVVTPADAETLRRAGLELAA